MKEKETDARVPGKKAGLSSQLKGLFLKTSEDFN